jgi:FecR protein
MMQSAKFGLLLAALAISSPALAAPDGWRISEKSGTVTVLHSGVSKIALQGNAVAVGDVISTGLNGRAVLVRGQEYLVVAPGSRLRVADPAPSGGFVQIIQDVGNVIFKIKRKSTPHFAVQTPYLAAVVKGTTFSVTVSEAGASVQVIEGAVEVKTNDGGASDLVKPGMIAAVTARDLFSLKVDGDSSQVTTSPNAPASQSPASESSATSATSETAATSAPAATATSAPVTAIVEAKIEAPIVEATQQVSALTGGLIEGTSTIVSPVRAEEVRMEVAAATPTPVTEAAVATPPATATAVATAPAPAAETAAATAPAQPAATPPAPTEVAAVTAPADMLPPAFDDDDDAAAASDDGKDEKTDKNDGNAKDVANTVSPPAPVEVAAVTPPISALPPEVDIDEDDDGNESDAAEAAREAEREKANDKKTDVAVVTPPAPVEVAAAPPVAALPPAVETDVETNDAAIAELEKANGKKKDAADMAALPPVAVEVAVVTPPAAVDVQLGNGNVFGLEKDSKGLKIEGGRGNSDD